MLRFVYVYGFRMVLNVNRDYFLIGINQLIFEMVKCCVLFEVRTEFLSRRASTSDG
jgi:hypothetical protein